MGVYKCKCDLLTLNIRRVFLPADPGPVSEGRVAGHGEGRGGGSVQADTMRVAHTVSEERRVHLQRGSDQAGAAVQCPPPALVLSLRGLGLQEDLSLPAIWSDF